MGRTIKYNPEGSLIEVCKYVASMAGKDWLQGQLVLAKAIQKEEKRVPVVLTEEEMEKKLYDFCRAHYYAVDEGEDRTLWEPFENYDETQVEEYIENDVDALKRFLTDLKEGV